MVPLITIEEKLKERIKELTCLYEVTSIIVNCDYDQLQKSLQAIVICLKDALRYSEQACVEIKTDDFFVSTEEFPKKMVLISSPIHMFNKEEGVLKAGYLNTNFTEKVFLYEEKLLLAKVAIEIGNLLERKKIQENEALLKRKVERADRISILGEITAGIAHELNTPLANILGFAELLKSRSKKNSQAEKDIDKIINSAIYSREVVKKLMFFACEMPQKKELVTINEVITDAINLLDPTFKKNKITYYLNYSHPSIQLKVDIIQLTQVIFNLILNAIYFSPEKGEIIINVTDNLKDVELKISDEGPGIKNSISDKIFEPFFTTKPVGDGSGLGLSVVHGIIKSHQGAIKHEPNYPKGTTFVINFPKL
ncbi:sensor histidine kinase [Lutibacter aestuarii]|uniref:histidine kinase n=1 Tax=Lutibacter aestuarii TaxID=861111 RepID=A0ABW2Z4I6_9FLAO|nr:HAMP domain-containing sensor histidine kinase [uncultured Lutibacter sp.]